jgi:RNA 3'-terminal phosphate cyclase (ATP)
MLELDGSRGEGGGQVLRTALAAAAVTGTAFRMVRIRARRPRPGLAPQHLAAVQAAAAIADGEVDGADRGSVELTFVPGALRPGSHRIDIGTAGSACLVAQLCLLPLRAAHAPSTVTVTGGTHNRNAPPADFLQRTFLPLVARTGDSCRLDLERHGFEPAGGGRLVLRVTPTRRPGPLVATDTGPARMGLARALVSQLPRQVAGRELRVLAAELGWPRDRLHIEQVEADGPGNVLLLEIELAGITEVICAFGRPGLPAEEVARQAIVQARRHLEGAAPVGEHLADQLLAPLALGGGGRFRTVEPTSHFVTNVEVLRRFVDVPISWDRDDDGSVLVAVGT